MKKLTRDIDTVSVTYKTTDYAQFVILDGNRDINQLQVSRLIRAIDKKDLLHQNPILVNRKMEIIDGQHRLYAARALGRPIYYRIEESADLEDTIILNANNRKWISDDYLNSFVKLGKPEYVKLKEYRDEYKLSTHLAVLIFGGLNTRADMQNFRDGNLVLKNVEESEKMASVIVELRSMNKDGAYHDRDLLYAVSHLIKKIDPKILLDKMRQHNIFLVRRISSKEYLVQFEEILNYQNNGQVVELV